jgi:hypothetical protein
VAELGALATLGSVAPPPPNRRANLRGDLAASRVDVFSDFAAAP